MSPFTLIKCLLALAILVLVPWAESPTRPRFHLFSAALAVASLAFSPGPWTALLAVPWLLYTASLAYDVRKPHAFFIPVGGIWLLFSRFGDNPMGFSEPIVTLTAIHFHYAAFLAPSLVDKAAKGLRLAKSVHLISYHGLLLGTVILAAGISFSREIEAVGGIVFAASLSTYAVATLFKARGWLVLSSISALFTILLAALYATIRPLDIADMALYHGVVNAFGFVGAGLLYWTLARSAPPDFLPWRSQALTSGLEDENKLFRRDVHSIELGKLDEAQYRRVVADVRDYRMFPPHLLRGYIDGDVVVQHIVVGPFTFETAVKIVKRQENGFWVATLKGHVERGLEAFLFDRKPDGSTSFRIEAHSQPAYWWGWLALPLIRYLQRSYSRKALAFVASRAQNLSDTR